MTKYKKGPCPCGESSDAFAEYENGSRFCFSCSKPFPQKKESLNMQKEFISYRGHSKNLLKKYDIACNFEEGKDKAHSVDYKFGNGEIKRRVFEPKKFYYLEGTKPTPGLFLADKFGAGSALAITVTEGEEDALSVLEMFDDKYPAVSVHSSSSALADCSAMYEYLNSFSKIYFCFDEDAPGQKALQQVAALFDFTKVYIVKKTKYKDANDYLVHNDQAEYRKIWYNARQFTPENVVSTFAEFSDILSEPNPPSICEYPWPDLQKMTKGIRSKEFALIKGLEGIGKTEVIGAIEIHALRTTQLNLGIIHLEEPIKRSLQRIATYDLKVPVHLAEDISPEDMVTGVKNVAGKDNRIYFYKNFGSHSIDGVLNQIRWLVKACHCKIVCLDHITRLVTGRQGGDERVDLDYIATRLAQLAEELDFAMIAISHVNDNGQTRGSRNITKEAATVIHITRDILNADVYVRNTTNFMLEKNRWASSTGPAGCTYFNEETFILEDKPPEILAPFGE